MEIITKESLKIPTSLEKMYIDAGWGDDYWKEIPYDWSEWDNKRLKQYPITRVIFEWRKQ